LQRLAHDVLQLDEDGVLTFSWMGSRLEDWIARETYLEPVYIVNELQLEVGDFIPDFISLDDARE